MTLLLLALIPALAVLYYYYNRDRHPEPWQGVATCFILGGMAIFPALAVERWLFSQHLGESLSPRARLFLDCVLTVGVTEESLKMLVVLVAVFWRRDFDEPVDGLIYGTAASMGFTFAEDWWYYVFEGASWPRAFSAVAHPWFACFWASSLGWARFHPWTRGIPFILIGLLCSALVHGIYDFLILVSQEDSPWRWAQYGLTPLLLLLYWALEKMLERADRPEVGARRNE